jgi:hypothetical protein
LFFHRGEEGVPDGPGIDRAALEGGTRIGRRQEYRLDIGVLQAVLFQRPDQ